MALTERTVPTHLGTPDKILDLGLVSLTVDQALQLFCAVVAASQVSDMETLPTIVRHGLVGIILLLGVVGAWCRIDGKSPWLWALAALRFARCPRQALWRPTTTAAALPRRTDWHEVTPALAWPTPGERA